MPQIPAAETQPHRECTKTEFSRRKYIREASLELDDDISNSNLNEAVFNMDNSTADASGDPKVGNTNMDSATFAGVISAALTFAALVVSSVQLLYQYYTNVNLSALGSRNCTYAVMGPWANLTRRRWRWLEFRFEVIFESPVIFVSYPNNKRGPVKNLAIHYMTGTEESFKSTMIQDEDTQQTETQVQAPRHRLANLVSLQKGPRQMEEASDENKARAQTRKALLRVGVNREASWVTMLRALQVMERDSRVWQDKKLYKAGKQTVQPFRQHTLAIAIQPRAYSWDLLPDFKNPFAQTVLTHIVEIAAMLGIYWTLWDSSMDRYRAEGNGYVLFGSYRPEQGLVFQFSRSGRSKFKKNRIIPADEVKKLCFGLMPTLFSFRPDGKHRERSTNSVDLKESKTIPDLKLGTRQDIAETLTVIGCPKSTADYFLNREETNTSHIFPVAFEILGMLGSTLRWRNSSFRMLPNPTIFRWDRKAFDTRILLRVFRSRLKDLEPDNDQVRHGYLQELIQSLDSLHDHLDPKKKDNDPDLLESLHDIINTIDSTLVEFKFASEGLILDTVGRHVSYLLDDLNAPASKDPRVESRLDKAISWAGSGVKEENYIDFLFNEVRDSVTIPRPQKRTTFAVTGGTRQGDSVRSDPVCLWYYLVLRMLCWLQLHDFDSRDVMLPRGGAVGYGSRMPVYII